MATWPAFDDAAADADHQRAVLSGPAVTQVFGVVLLGERVSAWMIAGAALIVSGNLLALLRRRSG